MADNILYFGGWEEALTAAYWETVNNPAYMTVVSDPASLSSQACRMSVSNQTCYVRITSPGLDAYGEWTAGADSYHVWDSFHFYIETLPGGGQYYYLTEHYRASGAMRIAVRIDSAGTIGLYQADAGTWLTGGTALQTGTWYVLSVYNGPGLGSVYPKIVVRLRDTGATVTSVTHTGSSTLGSATIRVGPSTASYGSIVFDNFVHEGSSTASAIDDPVNLMSTRYAVGIQTAAGQGSHSAWTGDYTDLDDLPHDGTSTQISVATTPTRESVTLTPTSAFPFKVGIIHAIKPEGLRASGTRATQLSAISSGTEQSTGTERTPGASYVWTGMVKTTDWGASSAPWTQSAVDSLEVCIRTGGGSGTGYCTALYNEVLYTVGVFERRQKTAYLLDAADPAARFFDGSGRELDYSKLRANRWLRVTSVGVPEANTDSSYVARWDMLYIEGLRYRQDMSGVSVGIQAGPDDFVPMLIARIAMQGGGV